MKKIFIVLNLVLNSMVFAQIPNYVPTNGLIGYWPFSGNANDQSVNLNNGSASGAILSSDRFGNPNSAYNFNGTSDYISVPDNPTLSGFNDISVSVWVKMNQFSGIQTFVSKWFYALNCGGNSDNYALALVNNSITSATNNNNVAAFYSPQNLSAGDLNVWKHIVFISNSALSYQAIYINGVLTGSTSVSGTICSSTNQLIFGAAIPTFRWFKGGLDDIGIWNRVLTTCEISNLYFGSTVNPTSSSVSICAGNSATLTAPISGLNYLWNTSATSSFIVVSPTVTTTYSVTQTNTLTSCSYTGSVTQSVSILSMSALASNSIICSGDAATLIVNGNGTSYFWNTSATGSVIVVNPTVTTTYTVFGTSAITGCTNTAMVTQNVSACTGIKKSNLNNLISVYPNPAKEYLNINISEAMEKSFFISIEDLIGKQIFKETFNDSDNKIGMEQFENGLYILKISDLTGNIITTKKIIVSKL